MADVTHVPDLAATPHAELFDDDAPRAVRLAIDAGESVPAHRHPDADVFLYVVSGDLDLDLDDERHRLGAGDAVRFDGDRAVSPRARSDATALVVFASR